MGSKNLKAIAVRGSGKVELVDRDKLLEITKNQVESSKQTPMFHGFSHLGTAGVTPVLHELGMYPVKNFQEGVLEGFEGLSPEELEKVFVKDVHCYNCYVHCGCMLNLTFGPDKGKPEEGPEYETMWSFGGEICNTNLGVVMAANKICDDYGIDTISCGVCVGFAMELYERGILKKDDLDGLDLRWGSAEAIVSLVKKIATREGIGNILAEGTKRAAQKIGGDAHKYAMHVKGLELPAYDPRGAKAHGLNLVTSNIGASHMTGYAPQELFGIPEPVDRFATEGKGSLAKKNQDATATYDSVIACGFPVTFGWLSPSVYGKLMVAATGIEEFGDEDYLIKAGERIYNLERVFNIREGFSRKDDTLPERLVKETPGSGPVKGQVFELDELLDQYYEARGWNKETGIPEKSKLEELDLEEAISVLQKEGKI